jgi:tetratricopeptide (TPR) repeat protein
MRVRRFGWRFGVAPVALTAVSLLSSCASDDHEWPPVPVGVGYEAYAPALQALAPPGAETRELTDGEPLYSPPIAESERPILFAELAAARVSHEHAPDDAGALITYGRRLGYVGRFRDAATVFTRGCERFPDDARMWRFRGHRWITLRQFDWAVDDLQRAEELIAGRPDEKEPSLAPNARGIDLDTLHENVHYHLALAHYLRGEFEEAAEAWARCLAVAPNADGVAMCCYWRAMALARAGRPAGDVAEALTRVTPDMDIVEYHSYHQLALVWKGDRDGDELLAATSPDDAAIDFATIGYGVGNWHWWKGDRGRALEIWRQVEAGPPWHAFGHIASEVELARQPDWLRKSWSASSGR